MSDYANYNSVVMLALIKYADLNFQYCLGMGWNSGDSRQVSSGDAILGDDGYNGATRDANASIKVMGITDLYGNVWKHNDAIFQCDGYVYVNDDLDSITEWPTMDTWQAMGYKKVDTTLSAASGWIKEFAHDSQFPWMTYPTKLGGDSTNPIGDYVFYSPIYSNNMYCVVLGSAAWYRAYNGPFCYNACDALLNMSYGIGCLASAFPKTNNN